MPLPNENKGFTFDLKVDKRRDTQTNERDNGYNPLTVCPGYNYRNCPKNGPFWFNNAVMCPKEALI